MDEAGDAAVADVVVRAALVVDQIQARLGPVDAILGFSVSPIADPTVRLALLL
jgi:hypothetical protein